MRVVKKKLRIKENGDRRRVGEICLVPESLDDLWHLKHVIDTGDLVYSLTYRRLDEATDKLRPDKVDKKPVRLGLRTDGIEFHKFSRRLRIKGMIEEGPETELGAYHTFNIEPGVELSIVKDWKEHQLKRIREAEKAVASPDVLLVTIEEGEAVAGIVRQYGVDELFSIRYGSGKGMERAEGSKREFFDELARQVKNSFQATNAEALIIAGPGFIKDDFVSFLKERDAELAKRTRLEQASSIGISGFLEVLKRGAVDRLKREERLTKEVTLLDRLMAEISKEEGGKAVYGKVGVRKALEYGAVETLLVSDAKLMKACGEEEEKEEEEIEWMLEEAERQGGDVIIFSTEFEPGKRLNALGGIAAILRFGIKPF
ncbi:MAG: mRNA surveillance protein pelota [Methanophagales archaeon ANME-1-THS]|nr:MAG: mRNA surveillance protein pelota [Methanophagales archaeon ANME-1-THS]